MTMSQPRVDAPRPIAHLTRQPIYDGKLRTVGYELIFKDNSTTSSDPEDGTRKTSTILADALSEFGLEQVVGTLPAWVSFSASYLAEKLPVPIGPKLLTVQVGPDCIGNDDAVERLRDLKQQAYRIVYDAFVLAPEAAELLQIADVVKLPGNFAQDSEIKGQISSLTKAKKIVLAKQVQTTPEYEHCSKLGFTLYQGNFVCQPELIRQKRVPTNRLALMHLLTELYSENPNIEKVRQLVQQDVTLSYRLFKWLNSALFALPHPVESIQHALVMLGLNRLRNLVSLMVLARIDDKPSELISLSLMRARIGERIAPNFNVNPETMFTVGLFSLLDAVVGAPMEQVLETMPLAPELQQAIRSREGTCGRLLSGIEAHERGDWAGVDAAGLDLAVLTPAWVDASVWVRKVRGMTVGAPASSHK
jgi:EAL and modified HD-GYP domain-containing signal transduction protein